MRCAGCEANPEDLRESSMKILLQRLNRSPICTQHIVTMKSSEEHEGQWHKAASERNSTLPTYALVQ